MCLSSFLLSLCARRGWSRSSICAYPLAQRVSEGTRCWKRQPVRTREVGSRSRREDTTTNDQLSVKQTSAACPELIQAAYPPSIEVLLTCP
jgi:hypothetical protein